MNFSDRYSRIGSLIWKRSGKHKRSGARLSKISFGKVDLGQHRGSQAICRPELTATKKAVGAWFQGPCECLNDSPQASNILDGIFRGREPPLLDAIAAQISQRVKRRKGPVASLSWTAVLSATLNQRAVGSTPTRPTKTINALGRHRSSCFAVSAGRCSYVISGFHSLAHSSFPRLPLKVHQRIPVLQPCIHCCSIEGIDALCLQAQGGPHVRPPQGQEGSHEKHDAAV